MYFELPPLPYPYNALEPYIDARTVEIHFSKHHATYLKNLNTALEKHPEIPSASIENLLRNPQNYIRFHKTKSSRIQLVRNNFNNINQILLMKKPD